ncbi:hypothetical protein MKW94_018467 [Papaver nudicaule]|uniref:Uncharacterized protein n=1 Tax=Papaver nudicaule TaxID=74823 RepID=A0AA41VHR6_PAPNU|nr:hypothetical protein [Papaver nudicaule]
MRFTCYSSPPCDGKIRWPELLGKTVAQAKAKILKDHPDPSLKFFILTPDMVPRGDLCCNRVNLFVNYSGIVTEVPMIG